MGSLFKSSTRFGRFSILLVNSTYEGKGGEQMKREKIIVPVIAPLKTDLTIDEDGVGKLTSFLEKANVDWSFVGDSTGEFASLLDDLKIKTIGNIFLCC